MAVIRSIFLCLISASFTYAQDAASNPPADKNPNEPAVTNPVVRNPSATTAVSNKIQGDTCKILCGTKKSCFTANGDCRFYNHCYINEGVWYGFVQPCPFGLHFHEDIGVCNRVKKTNCSTDPCKTHPEGTVYSHVNEFYATECDGAYWECKNGFSEAHCCAETQIYVEGQGCVDGNGCVNHCVIPDSERCEREGVGHQFQKLDSRCGQYYECQSDHPEHAMKKCCDPGHKFVELDKKCIPDEACQDPCGDIAFKNACNIAKVNDYEFRYINNNQTRKCRTGTMVGSNGKDCFTCVEDPSALKLGQRCKQPVFLDFENTRRKIWDALENKGGQPSWVGANNIFAKNGVMKFGLENDVPRFIIVPSYHGVNMPEIYAEIRFRPSTNNVDNQVMMSNCESIVSGTFSPSFDVKLSPTEIIVTVVVLLQVTETLFNEETATVKVSYATDVFNNMKVNYNGIELSLSNTPDNGAEVTDSVMIAGDFVKKSDTGMHIGSCNFKETQFYGEIDEIQIWDCKPSVQVPKTDGAQVDPAGTAAGNVDSGIKPVVA